MPKYRITQTSTYLDTFEVEAATEDEAKEKVLDGELDPIETGYLTSDMDSNNLEVTRVDAE